MSLLGPEGLKQTALSCHQNTQQLLEKLTAIDGVELVFDQPRFQEAVRKLSKPADEVLAKLAQQNILGGLDLSQHFAEMQNCILVCATELRIAEDIDTFASALAAALK